MPQTPVFRAAGAWSFTGNNVATPATLTPGAPAGKTVGDLLILVCESRSIVGTVATPTGWTLVTGFPKRSATASGGSIYLFTRTADGTATDTPSPVWSGLGSTGTSGDSCGAGILCYTNTVSATLDASPVVSDLSAQSATSTITGITTANYGALALAIAFKVVDSAAASASSWTERVDAATTSGTGHELEIADLNTTDPGATSNSTVTWGTTTSSRVFGVVVAFRATVAATTDAATLSTATTPSATEVPPPTVTEIGRVINDAYRTLNIDGDGLTVPDSSYGLWRGSTNLVTNGGFETNLTDWFDVGIPTRTRITTDSKFGSACQQIAPSALGDGAAYHATISAVTTYTSSVWIKVPSGSTVRVRLSDSGGMSVTQDVIGDGTWHRITLTGTTSVAVATATFQMFLLSGTVANFYIDGVQVEQQPYATPYIETNGASASRAASYVTAPSSVLSKTQGWIAVRFRLGDLVSTVGHTYATFYADSSNLFKLLFQTISVPKVIATVFAAGSFDTTTVNLPGTPASGDFCTALIKWDGTNYAVSVDGSNFVSGVLPGVPTGSYQSFVLGIAEDLTFDNADTETLWVAAGTGTLSNGDAATIHAKGNTDDLTNWPSLSAPTFFWPADYANYYVPTVAAGTSYTESATITSKTTPSATDVAAYVETATISSITTPNATEIYTPPSVAYTESATITTRSVVSEVETAQFVDSSQITTVSSVISSDVAAYVDLNTVKTISSVISSDILAAVEAATITTITTPISAELHEIFDSSTITGITTPSSAELHEIPDSSSITGTTTVTTLDTAQYVDASTTTTTTTPISTDIAQYVDAATTTTTTTPSTTDVVVVIDASTSTTITVVISSDVAAYVDAATLTTKTTVTSAELREIADSNTISGTTFITTLDTAQYVDANKPTAITTPSADEQQSGATSDANTLKTTTSISYTEAAQFADTGTATSTTSISTTDAPIYGDSGTVPTTSIPTSADIAGYVDAALVSAVTTPSATEVGAFIDSATLTSITSISYVDAPVYGDSDSLLTTTTPTSDDVATFTDFNTATTITSLSALETKTSGNTDFATVTTITYIITVREGIFLLVDLIPSPLLARWYHTTTLTSRYPVRVFQKWAAGLLTNRYNVNDYKKWVTSWIR